MRFLKGILILLISIACVGLVPAHAEEETETFHTGYRKLDTQQEHLSKAKIASYRGKTYKEEYDPRHVNGVSMVTSVKDQKLTETCWAYAVIAVAESNLIKQGLADNTIDLSEHHLAYYTYNTTNDPLGNTKGDKAVLPNGYNYLSLGGNCFFPLTVLSGYNGLVAEEDFYEMPNDSTGAITEDNMQYEYQYSLKNAYFGDNSIDTIKGFVSEYGAAGMSYEYSDDEKTMSLDNNSIYNPYGSINNANHTVTIVGWDDNYSKDNFTIQPNNDGAWLVKNSWGDIGSENGYFWMSYEEPSITEVFTAEFEKVSYDNVYYYDGNLDPAYFYNEGEMTIANIYHVKANQTGNDELLQAVNIGVGSDNVEYEINIYKNLTDENDPTSGTLMTNNPINGQVLYEGYYTIQLSEPIVLSQDETYSIVVTLKKPDDIIAVLMEMYEEASWIKLECNVEENQSFYYHDGWNDCANFDCSARIKGLTTNIDTKSVLKIELPKTQSINVGDKQKLEVVITPSDASEKLIWKSSDSSIVTVNEDGNIEGISPGQATITVTNGQGITSTCIVTVKDRISIETDDKISDENQNNTLNQNINHNVSIQNHVNEKQSIDTSDDTKIDIWLGVMAVALIGFIIVRTKSKK